MNRPTSRKPSARALQILRGWIDGGQFTPGERLPSEEALAAELQVGRRSVRTALSHLQREGLVQPLNQRVRIVSPRPPTLPRSGNSVMAHTVLILSEYEGTNAADRAGGWEIFAERGMVDAIHDRGWLSLTILPKNLSRTQVDALCSDPPLGIVGRDSLYDLPLGQELMQRLQQVRVPIVQYGFMTAPSSFDRVTTDHQQGCYDLTRWLIGQGRQRILRLWLRPQGCDPAPPHWLCERDLGYERAVREAGLPALPAIRAWGGSPGGTPQPRALFERTMALVADVLRDWFSAESGIDAVMAISDGLVFAAAAACRKLGKDPERDLTIVGYDNYWQQTPEGSWANFIPAATVDKHNREIGTAMIALLHDRLLGKLAAEPQNRVVPQKLIVIPQGQRGLP